MRELGTLYSGYAHESVNRSSHMLLICFCILMVKYQLPVCQPTHALQKSTKKHLTYMLFLQQDIVLGKVLDLVTKLRL